MPDFRAVISQRKQRRGTGPRIREMRKANFNFGVVSGTCVTDLSLRN